MSGHGKNLSTHKLEQRERQIRTRNNPGKEEHLLPGEPRGRDISGHGKNRVTEQHLLSENTRERELTHGKEASERGARTD
jgi:hypothetical protein